MLALPFNVTGLRLGQRERDDDSGCGQGGPYLSVVFESMCVYSVCVAVFGR